LATNGHLSHQPKDIAPCGEVCSYGGTVPPNTDQICLWPQIHKHFNCDNIMKRMAYRNHVIIDPPPTYPPDYLLDEFTMFEEMSIIEIQYYSTKLADFTKHFSLTFNHDVIQILKRGENVNVYPDCICVQHFRYIKCKGSLSLEQKNHGLKECLVHEMLWH